MLGTTRPPCGKPFKSNDFASNFRSCINQVRTVRCSRTGLGANRHSLSYILFALLLLSVTRSSCLVQRGPLCIRHDAFARPAVVSTRQGFSAVQEVLLDLPEGQVSHTRQVTPRSDFEKGDIELQE